MKRILLLSALLLILTGTKLYSQARIAYTLTISDNAGGNQTLTLGFDHTATDGIDAALGEVERPPIPPSGAFDARFIGDDIGISIGQGTITDFRCGSVKSNQSFIHEIKYQVKSGGTQITIGWSLPSGVAIRIQDLIFGTYINVLATGSGSTTIDNPGGINKLKLTTSYTIAEMPKKRVTNTLSVSDNSGSTQILVLGVDPKATDGLDATLGEIERPALPPAGEFDVRFTGEDIALSLGRGICIDYRPGDDLGDCCCVHEIKYQLKTGENEITIGWDLSRGVTLLVQNFLDPAFDKPLAGSGTYTFNTAGMNKLKLTATYDADVMPVELCAFQATIMQGVIALSWKTGSELNNYGFEVERRSGNLGGGAERAWRSIGFVEGSGTCWVPKTYTFMDRTALPFQGYLYRLKQIDRDGSYNYSSEIEASVSTPMAFILEQNYPNPFNPTTVIRYALPYAAHVTLDIYDLIGERVAILVDGELEAGYHTVEFNAASLASGIYFYRLQAGPFSETKKIIVMH